MKKTASSPSGLTVVLVLGQNPNPGDIVAPPLADAKEEVTSIAFVPVLGSEAR